MKARRPVAIVLLWVGAVWLAAGVVPAQGQPTIRLSIDATGNQGNAPSGDEEEAPSSSQSGDSTAYSSEASNLGSEPGLLVSARPPAWGKRDVAGLVEDDNGERDVFVHDRRSGLNLRVSVDSLGRPGNDASRNPSLSADGRIVAFESDASNFVSGDGNDAADIFVHDIATGLTERVSRSSLGGSPNGASRRPSISADGRYVAFESVASNIVPGDSNGASDIFVFDRLRMTTTLASATSGQGANGDSFEASLAADGSAVAFTSAANNLVPGDANGALDVFVRQFAPPKTVLASKASAPGADGDSSSPSLSADGRLVAFESSASNLGFSDLNHAPDVYLAAVGVAVVQRVSTAAGLETDGGSTRPSLSADGSTVSFRSRASNLVPDDTNGVSDVFVRTENGPIRRASLSTGGAQGDAPSGRPGISGDGLTVAFSSQATTLVGGDTNGYRDVFANGDEERCPGGQPDKGPVSGLVHDSLEPALTPASRDLHRIACLAASLGA